MSEQWKVNYLLIGLILLLAGWSASQHKHIEKLTEVASFQRQMIFNNAEDIERGKNIRENLILKVANIQGPVER